MRTSRIIYATTESPQKAREKAPFFIFYFLKPQTAHSGRRNFMQNNKRYITRLLKGMLASLPMIFWVLLIFSFDAPYIAILTFSAAAIHELGHILATLILLGKFELKASLTGFGLRTGTLSYRAEFLIALSGPLMNVIAFAACALLSRKMGEYVSVFGIINLFTAISNLLPIESYDGYRILSSLLSRFFSPEKIYTALSTVSLIINSLLIFLVLYLMVKLNSGYFIFFVLVFLLIKTFKKATNSPFRRKQEKKRVSERFRELFTRRLRENRK